MSLNVDFWVDFLTPVNLTERRELRQGRTGSTMIIFGSVSSLDLDDCRANIAMKYACLKMCFEDKRGENLK